MQPPAVDHEGAPVPVVGAQQAVLEPEPPAKGQRPGLLGDEGVGPALDEEAVAPLGLDGAAQPIRALEQGQVQRASPLAGDLDRAMGRREPGDASPDDDQPHPRYRDDISWTMSTRARTWSTGVSAWTP